MTLSINIKIIYDSKYEKRGRTCYWLNIGKKIVESPNNEKTKVIIKIDDGKPDEIISNIVNGELNNYEIIFSFEFISVKEILNSENPSKIVKDLFNKEQTDIIIINWDSINGDPVYGSFEAYQFFNMYMPTLNEWVEDGGIIILEAQTVASKLVQSPYDIFTKETKNCYVKTFNKLERGDIAIINKKLVNLHPILTNISNNKWEPKIDPEPGFPDPVLSTVTTDHKKRRLFAGYFSKYSKDWDPLLYADIGMKKPIMLCRLVKKEKNENVGGYILTTMYIGATSFDPIVKNLLIFPKKSETYYNNKKEDANKRQMTYLKAFIVFIIISISVGLLFSQGLINNSEFIKKNILQIIATICAIILVLFGPGTLFRIWTKWKGKE